MGKLRGRRGGRAEPPRAQTAVVGWGSEGWARKGWKLRKINFSLNTRLFYGGMLGSGLSLLQPAMSVIFLSGDENPL